MKREALAEISSGTARSHPLGRPFPPGVSGNPGGRPRTLQSVVELARSHSEEAIEALVGCLRVRNPRVRLAAAVALLDRAWGKPSAMEIPPATISPEELAERLQRLAREVSAAPAAEESHGR